MRQQCKCHGVSGACNVRTCWQTLAEFNQVGSYLKDRYNSALQVSSDPSGTALISVEGTDERTVNSLNRRHQHQAGRQRVTDALVYLDTSPDYCSYDPLSGALGTAGRMCNKTSTDIDGCDLLCCGRGYDTRRVLVTEPCRCTFKWCCSVECKTCSQWKDQHFCKPLHSFEMNRRRHHRA